MARITQEQIEQINELYLVHKNKSLVARLVGVSVASVNKYLIPGYAGKDSVLMAVDLHRKNGQCLENYRERCLYEVRTKRNVYRWTISCRD